MFRVLRRRELSASKDQVYLYGRRHRFCQRSSAMPIVYVSCRSSQLLEVNESSPHFTNYVEVERGPIRREHNTNIFLEETWCEYVH
jgi:hypothetical protein